MAKVMVSEHGFVKKR